MDYQNCMRVGRTFDNIGSIYGHGATIQVAVADFKARISSALEKEMARYERSSLMLKKKHLKKISVLKSMAVGDEIT